MPINKTSKGYKFGKGGKTYKTKEQAIKQMKAIYASGWKENKKKVKIICIIKNYYYIC